MEHEKSLNLVTSDGDEAFSDPKHPQLQTGKEKHDNHDGAHSDIVHGHLAELEVDLARVIGEDEMEGDWDADTSPFAAVRAVVPETDDPDMPVNTARAWVLGIVSHDGMSSARELIQHGKKSRA